MALRIREWLQFVIACINFSMVLNHVFLGKMHCVRFYNTNKLQAFEAIRSMSSHVLVIVEFKLSDCPRRIILVMLINLF